MKDEQFFHIETYGRATRSSRPTIKAVIKEATRYYTHSKHVKSPISPTFVFGSLEALQELPNTLDKLCALSQRKTGKKVAKDAQLLCAGVASYPKTVETLKEDLEEWVFYRQWQDLCLSYLKARYQGDLMCVLVHEDEPFPHLHFYVLPKLLPSGKILLDAHPGRMVNLTKRHLTGAERRKLYIEAMRAEQLAFHKAVGEPMGWSLKSLNPRKRSKKKERTDERLNPLSQHVVNSQKMHDETFHK